MELAERFVAAAEQIAASLATLAENPVPVKFIELEEKPRRGATREENMSHTEAPLVTVPVPEEAPEPEEAATVFVPSDPDGAAVGNGYESMDRDALFALCVKRGIEVPPRTRTTTLVKKLNTADKIAAVEAPKTSEPIPEATATEEIPAGEVEDPFAVPDPASTGEVEADPFAMPEPEPEKEVTKDDVIGAMQAVHEKKGTPAVLKLLAQFGVAKIKDLDPGDYAKAKLIAETALTAMEAANG